MSERPVGVRGMSPGGVARELASRVPTAVKRRFSIAFKARARGLSASSPSTQVVYAYMRDPRVTDILGPYAERIA